MGNKEIREECARTFQDRVEKVHNNPMYDFSKAVYVNNTTKVTAICSDHGEWQVAPNKLLVGRGCPDCGELARAKKKVETASKKFFKRMEEVYIDDQYDFSKVVYITAKTKVIVTCKDHGDFLIDPDKLMQGCGCKECGHIKAGKSQRDKAARELEGVFREVHGDGYGYDRSIYVDDKTHIDIFCKTCNKYFKQAPSYHKQGAGCSSCNSSGFRGGKPAILYYLRVETRNQIAYKVGITNRTVKDRYSVTDLSKITVLSELSFQQGADAYKEEQAILKEYSEYRYVGDPLLENGNSELFTKDILNKDNYEGF